MKRNKQNIILIVLLAVFCLCILAACGIGEVDYFTYSEDDLGVVGKLVRVMHGWVGNYGWTVVVFTVFLKILMSPLDIWQRVSSRKSTLRMQRMQPLIAEIDKRYASNPQRANEEKQKLYKKQGFSAFSMCLPMIISMVIFLVMFTGLQEYSAYSSVKNFQNLSGTYYDEYYNLVVHDTQLDSAIVADYQSKIAELADESEGFGENPNFLHDNYTEQNIRAYRAGESYLMTTLGVDGCDKYQQGALEAVSEYYVEHHESWLWMYNVWQPDTWVTIMPKYSDSVNGFEGTVNMDNFSEDKGRTHYDAIWNAVVKTGGYGSEGKWNGLMLLPFLSIALSFLSIFISQRLDKRMRKDEQQQAAAQQNPQQAISNKLMMFLMPLMMAFFGFRYTGAFAIYMVCNYLLSLTSTLALARPVEKIVQRSLAKKEMQEKSNKASYMR